MGCVSYGIKAEMKLTEFTGHKQPDKTREEQFILLTVSLPIGHHPVLKEKQNIYKSSAACTEALCNKAIEDTSMITVLTK